MNGPGPHTLIFIFGYIGELKVERALIYALLLAKLPVAQSRGEKTLSTQLAFVFR